MHNRKSCRNNIQTNNNCDDGIKNKETSDVYNDKSDKKSEFKFSAFGGMDSLLSIVEMPNGSPVATVGVNKAANAGLYAAKILAAEFTELKPKLKKFKEKQHQSVLAESDELKKSGLSRFVQKKFK